ncbi:hypothetical protein K438DRAFT_1990509 [Mycena galopus ATCC 62051]|nr:hypothetical protein K438DRAFT_1990509 [Mycena galopus ATCC 62051]
MHPVCNPACSSLAPPLHPACPYPLKPDSEPAAAAARSLLDTTIHTCLLIGAPPVPSPVHCRTSLSTRSCRPAPITPHCCASRFLAPASPGGHPGVDVLIHLGSVAVVEAADVQL